MPCGNFLLCHVSYFHTIINNCNRRWRSILQIKKSKNLHIAMCQILMDGSKLMTLTDIMAVIVVELHSS
jgi:hypothetical protein